MTTGKRGVGEPLQVDELRGQNGYIDRMSSGLTSGDILRTLFKRSRFLLIIFGGLFIVMSLLMLPVDIMAFLFMLGMLTFIFAIVFGMVFLIMLCTWKQTAKAIMENNYLLLLNDRLVIQSQSDLMTLVLRNEIPRDKIGRIEHIQSDYIRERRSRTNICLRFLTGGYLPPVGGLYPVPSKKENLMIIHLNRPHEIHCCGRNQNGMYQLGDKREYVKEIIVSVDPGSQRRLLSQLNRQV
jgi:hypothetical protein